MKIAVTGGSGFIGSHVIRTLSAAGHQVANIDRRDQFWPCDLLKRHSLGAHLRGAEAIIHCAAIADVRRNWEPGQIADLVNNNEAATRALLEAAVIAGSVNKLVFVSSGAAYADQLSPYAASKLSGEFWCKAYAARFGWHLTIARPAACYGTGYHHGHVADFVSMARTKGSIESLTNGRPRDGLHVEDCAGWLARFATSNTRKYVGGAYYLRAEKQWGCRDTARLIGAPVSWGADESGWVGDNTRSLSSDLPCGRSVESGVRQALVSLGWVAQC